MKFNRNYLFLVMLSLAGCFEPDIQGDRTPASEAPRERPRPQPKDHDLKSPTWEELKKFLEEDKGDSKTYILGEYDCKHFSKALKRAAESKGFETAYVSLRNMTGASGHAINAFNTLDHGLIYIEPQHDQVAYVRIGQTFGSVPIEAVKYRNFTCPNNSSDLIHSLNVEFYEGKLFEYEFYPYYKARVACFEEAAKAHNDEIKKYNDGKSRFTLRQLEMWRHNLRLLGQDIGFKRTTPPDFVVSKIERQWA